MANKFGDKNAISRYKKSRDGESGEDAAVADFLGSHGVDRWVVLQSGLDFAAGTLN